MSLYPNSFDNETEDPSRFLDNMMFDSVFDADMAESSLDGILKPGVRTGSGGGAASSSGAAATGSGGAAMAAAAAAAKAGAGGVAGALGSGAGGGSANEYGPAFAAIGATDDLTGGSGTGGGGGGGGAGRKSGAGVGGAGAGVPKKGEPMSVTLLSSEQLPRCSAERFHMLSELERQAHSTTFIPDLEESRERELLLQQQKSSMSGIAPAEGASGGAGTGGQAPSDDTMAMMTTIGGKLTTTTAADQKQQLVSLPPFVLLYLLWRPDMPQTTPEGFVDEVILKSVSRIKDLVRIVNSVDKAMAAIPPPPLPKNKKVKSSGPSVRFMDDPVTSESDDKDGKAGGKKDAQAGKESVKNGRGDAGGAQSAPSSQEEKKEDSNKTWTGLDKNNKEISLYVIVDRIALPEKQSWWKREAIKHFDDADVRFHTQQHDMAEQLARSVASHPELRGWCEGITVGVSNHARAAPGLEACLDAVNVGKKDRQELADVLTSPEDRSGSNANTRTPASSLSKKSKGSFSSASDDDGEGEGDGKEKKSWIGIIADRPGDFLGLQSEDFTEAAKDVMQSRVCAEWNGQGNLSSFAARAHTLWRIHRGLPRTEPEGTAKKKKVPRRKASKDSSQNHPKTKGELDGFDPTAMENALVEVAPDAAGFMIVLFYIVFNFPETVKFIFWVFDSAKWDAMIQSVRSL